MKSIIHSRRLRERMTLQLKKKSWLAEHHHNIFHFILRRVSRILKPKHILQMRCYSKNFFFTHDHSISDISFWSIATSLFFLFWDNDPTFLYLDRFCPPCQQLEFIHPKNFMTLILHFVPQWRHAYSTFYSFPVCSRFRQ